jgi:PDZ domain-containing protein
LARRVLKGAGAVAVVALGIGLNFYQLPVVTLLPGPVEDVLPQVSVEGAQTFDSDGRLYLTTVGVDDKVNFYEALLQFADQDVEVLPRELLYPSDRTDEEIDTLNAAEMDGSKLTATVVGLREAGYDVDGSPTGVRVTSVVSGSAADGNLLPGDSVLAVQGKPVSDADQVRQMIQDTEVNTRVTFTVERDGDTQQIDVTTIAKPDGPRTSFVGIGLSNTFDFPVDVEIGTDNIGGPSAGLMFSLGIVDKLTEEDLTHGRRIAGTGTIGIDGTVGAIGGIRQKLIASRREGASVFLTPGGNWEEASQHAPSGLELVRVDTIDDALTYLREQPSPATSASGGSGE